MVGGVGAVVQLEGLADGAKRVLNRAKADLMSTACVPCTDVSGKAPKDVKAALRCGDICEKWVHLTDVMAEIGPMGTIAQVDFLGLSHDPVGTRFPSSKEKTSEVSFLSGRSMVHEASCERGKSELNLVRN